LSSESASRVAGRGLTDEAAAAAFTRWLSGALGVSGLTLGASEAPPFNGASNDTLVVQASWTGGASGGSGGFVIRRPPTGASLYQHYDLAAQYATMAALVDTDVPVPPLVGYEPDASVLGSPFYVMGEVSGQAPPDLPPYTQVGWVLPLSNAEQSQLYSASIEMLARVHRLDAAALALSHLPGGPDGGGLAAQLDSVESWYRWAVTGVANPVLDATLAWLLSHRPAPSPEGLNWGDARIGNMMYRNLAPVAVLDWEMAAIGPAEVDLGWWLFMYRFHTEGMEALPIPGFPDDATTVALWEAAVGRSARDVHYYTVLAGFRFGIIVLRAARKMVEAGQLAPEQSYERVNGATLILADLLGLPTPV
jgi:aminoglycoside phosphotransferase (APT) family kinase protein